MFPFFENCMGILSFHTLSEFTCVKILLKDLDNLLDANC